VTKSSSGLRGIFARVFKRNLPESESVAQQAPESLPDARKPSDVSPTQTQQQRADAAIETLLENVSLTSELTDDAAKVLLDWGSDCVWRIARDTAHLNDAEVEEAMAPRLRATRRLMRSVSRWVPERQGMSAEKTTEMMTRILEYAAIVYAERYVPPQSPAIETFLRDLSTSGYGDSDVVARLRAFIEPPANAPQPTTGAAREQQPQ
jgi:hypothetical protein